MIELNSRKIAESILIELGHEPTPGQAELIGLLSDFIAAQTGPKQQPGFLIKGYAGTGKTTLVSALVRVLPLVGMQSVLLAPTGRAAKVLAGYARKNANTIHRKIYRSIPGSDGRLSMTLAPSPHKNTIFIVDEASMIPGSGASADQGIYSNRDLLNDLVNYIFNSEGCKLLLIGDSAQLPPVGTDQSPALDLEVLQRTYHLDISAFELREVVRQSLESGILTNATYLRKQAGAEKPELPFFNLSGFADIQQIDGSMFEDALNTCYSKYGYENTAIITRSNKRANLFNNEVRARILFRETELSAGDIIMITRNNYFWLPSGAKAGFIANGDMAEVRRIMKTGEMYGFRFADITIQLVDYPDQEVIEIKLLLDSMVIDTPSLPQVEHQKLYDEIMLDYSEISSKAERQHLIKNNPYYNAVQAKFAYALTCHKTQGGQWDAVFIDHGYLTSEMVDSNFVRWLYTAITRATKEVYLVNFNSDFFEGK
ncbi:MAG: ATP-dependent endonuclease [Bacteroidetes bacterium HGW-Bacteroidetes-9]|jgi:exodeoxyribonuclease-5|nr:MAG: ATP-dependent endonuclease [Bacteroidetes bacterium HGW-Bacteroidetes-9]